MAAALDTQATRPAEQLPANYLERVYAGILGKLIGVYLGRPFEGWTHNRIMKELGPIEFYVSQQLNQPLVVTDDDIAGTFTFLRALEDYRLSPDLSAEEIGKAWLNYLVEGRSVLWWGGNGTSTEHTAWLNLKRGIPAPESGSVAANGQTLAEQIGAQIFIDGWAMVAPGRPALAARLAEQAGKVSHDGEAVHAAMLWAAMEAQAFVSADIDHLIDTGLEVIPPASLIARLVADIRGWHREHADWRDTRQLIENTYGYDKFPGICHVVPNHALMIMSVLYAPDDFSRAQTIVNTSGWDTDCNAGNVGCLLGLMHGLNALDAGPDWRGPVADRCLISSADGGNAINDAVRLAYFVAGLGRRLAGGAVEAAPKMGARYHFSLPGSTQGFQAQRGPNLLDTLEVGNAESGNGRALALRYSALRPGRTALALTPTFATPDVPEMRSYELMATPLVYPGQVVSARLAAAPSNRDPVTAALHARIYGCDDRLEDASGEPVTLQPGETRTLAWRLPEFDGQPVAALGVALTAGRREAEGTVLLDFLRWDGTPETTLHRPSAPGNFWHRAWVNGVSAFSTRLPQSFRISQSRGEGIIIHGTREWRDYRVEADLTVHLGRHAGLAVRVQGLRRFYAARLTQERTLQLVRVRDETTTVLDEMPFNWDLERSYQLAVDVAGQHIACTVGDARLMAEDAGEDAFAEGGIGLLVFEGALSSNTVRVGPSRS